MIKKNVIAAMASASLALTAGQAAIAGTIKIGMIAPVSGGYAVVGSPMVQGAQMVVDQVNASGGINGDMLELVVRDSQVKPDVAVAAARELISSEGVALIIGPATSGASLAVAEVAKTEKVVNISPSAKTDEITTDNPHPYIFQIASTGVADGPRFGKILQNEMGAKEVCFIAFDYAFGHVFVAETSKNLSADQKVGDVYYVPLGTTDFNTSISQLMGSKCDTVATMLFGGGLIAFVKQAGPFGLFSAKKTIMGGNAGDYAIAAALKGELPEGIWAQANDLWYYNGSQAHTDYIAALAKVQGKEHTDMWPISGYYAMTFAVEALKKAGSTDSDAISKALEGLTIATPLGDLTMGAQSHRASAPEFYGATVAVEGSDIKQLANPMIVR